MVEKKNGGAHPGVMVERQCPVPVIGRHYASSLQQLTLSYRKARAAVILSSDSRFAPGYVIDNFLAGIDADTTVIRITRACSRTTEFMREIVRSIGFDSNGLSLTDLDDLVRLFLQRQKKLRLRTVLTLNDVDLHARPVMDKIRELVEKELKEAFGLMVILSGPSRVVSRLIEPVLDDLPAQAADRLVLTPFILSETREFVRQRFENNNSGKKRTRHIGGAFEFYAVSLIHEMCSGVPDDIDRLCKKCLELANRTATTRISTEAVKSAAKSLGLTSANGVGVSDRPTFDREMNFDSPGQLIIRVEGEPERNIPLEGGCILIGRDRLCDICLSGIEVSRFHGLFARSGDRIHYVDLGSTNGSAINGERAERSVLQDNDVIAVGDVRIIYSAKRESEPTAIDLDPTDNFKVLDLEPQPPINYVGDGIRQRLKS